MIRRRRRKKREPTHKAAMARTWSSHGPFVIYHTPPTMVSSMEMDGDYIRIGKHVVTDEEARRGWIDLDDIASSL